MYDFTLSADRTLTLTPTSAEDSTPIISTPCDETLPEWVAIAGWIAFTFVAAGATTLAAFGLL